MRGDDQKCQYEITAENHDEEREGCTGIIASEDYDEIVQLRNRDALLSAKALEVPYDEIALVALLNGSAERYCLRIFGGAPSEQLAEMIEEEDELLDCSESRIPRVSVAAIESEPEGGFRVYVIYDCGLTGRCQSGWWVFVSRKRSGELIVTGQEVDWIT